MYSKSQIMFRPSFTYNDTLDIKMEFLDGKQCYINVIISSTILQLDIYLTWVREIIIHCDIVQDS